MLLLFLGLAREFQEKKSFVGLSLNNYKGDKISNDPVDGCMP